MGVLYSVFALNCNTFIIITPDEEISIYVRLYSHMFPLHPFGVILKTGGTILHLIFCTVLVVHCPKQKIEVFNT